MHMKHTNLWKQIVAVLLVLVLSVSLITPSIAVDADAAQSTRFLSSRSTTIRWTLTFL